MHQILGTFIASLASLLAAGSSFSSPACCGVSCPPGCQPCCPPNCCNTSTDVTGTTGAATTVAGRSAERAPASVEPCCGQGCCIGQGAAAK